MAVVVATCGWVILTADDGSSLATAPLGNMVFVTRALLAVVLGFVVLGIIGDLRPAGRRTAARLADRPATPGGILGTIDLATDVARIFVDEIAPGGQRARRAAGMERSRIAVELHADLVPVVRRALHEAEQGGSPERLVVALRDVLAQVDGLRSIEARSRSMSSGLLPAIEWLAERTEERSECGSASTCLNVPTEPCRVPQDRAGARRGTWRLPRISSSSWRWRTSFATLRPRRPASS